MRKNILTYLEETVKEVPDKTAFADDASSLTFQQLSNYAMAIGTLLSEKNLYKEPVVVLMDKSPDTIAAFLGVVYGGCYYIPMDAEMPKLRMELILEKVQSKLIITDEKNYDLARSFGTNMQVVLFKDAAKTMVQPAVIENIRNKALDIDPIYVVFTSGSTGVPKGVTACHRSVIDYVDSLSEVLAFNRDSVFGNQTPLYFDACLKEVFGTLKFGGTTYFVPKSYFMFPLKLVEYLNEHKINTVCWVVSALTVISSTGTFEEVVPKYLKTIAFGSEVFPIKQFNLWRSVLPDAKFINLYGPTEGTGMCCYYKVNRDFELDEVIPIGRPFDNTEILLLNEKNELVAEGESGEICIRGTSVTLGYYKDAEKTSQSYVQNPLNTLYPEIIYRTGDLAKYNEHGELVFVSRKDYQIKHMGHRIELGEIEANVNRLDGIQAACCVYDTSTSKIVLYYTGEIEKPALTKALKEYLPRYMMPNYIEKLEQMPLTPNGKLNRVLLKEKFASRKG